MGDLAWTCDGRTFSCERNGLRLLVAPAAAGGGFRYEMRRPGSGVEPGFPVASGHQAELRDALAAAERLAQVFVPGPPPLQTSV